MLICPPLILLGLLFLTASHGEICPRKCICTSLTSATLRVDCSQRKLDTLPAFPKTTEELYLQDNLLTGIPTGTFDHLMDLKTLNLSFNPLHCDCNIWYLKMWLDDHHLDKDNSTKCLTPRPLYGTPVTQIAGVQMTLCSRRRRLCSDFLLNDALLCLLFLVLIFLMIVCLKTLKVMRVKLKVTDNDRDLEPREAQRLRSLKRRYQRHFVKSC